MYSDDIRNTINRYHMHNAYLSSVVNNSVEYKVRDESREMHRGGGGVGH